MDKWIEMEIEHMTVEEATKILDDASCHGFEIKVTSGKIFFIG